MPIKENLNSHKKEIAGFICLALGLLTGFSLINHSEGSSVIGTLGNYFSWFLLAGIGYTAYLVPILFFTLSYFLIIKKDDSLSITYVKPLSLLFLILSLSVLLHQLSNIIAPLSPFKKIGGGIMGSNIFIVTQTLIGPIGAFMVFFLIFVVALKYATGLTYSQILSSMWAGTLFIFKKIKSLKDKFKKAKEELPQFKKSPQIIEQKKVTQPKVKKKEPVQEPFEFVRPKGSFSLPPISLLDPVPEKTVTVDKETIITNSKILEKKLEDFDVKGRVKEVRPGPVVTLYEFEPAPGVKVNKIVNLTDDLALAMRAMSIRIEAPIPGKSVVGIEIPNLAREFITFREMAESNEFAKSKSPLSIILGRDITGNPYMSDLKTMPHLLVAGATGSGKSVSVNAMIMSILYKATPQDVRFMMIDPKMLELSVYEEIPHLLTPVITDVKRASYMLKTMVTEMLKRYKLMAEKGVKNIDSYNRLLQKEEKEKKKQKDAGEVILDKDVEQLLKEEEKNMEEEKLEHKHLPYIVIVIDELADLMLAAGRDVEESLVRLSQMARASGIHLLIATQRPSVDVLTGIIKANFPARIALKVPSRTDSRVILDSMGAETLLGKGDMLFLPPGTSKIERIHGVYVTEEEIHRVTDYLKKQGSPNYDVKVAEHAEKAVQAASDDKEEGSGFMEKYRQSLEMAMSMDMISASYIQRRMRVGYNTAARMIEKMEEEGIVGPPRGSKPREVLKKI